MLGLPALLRSRSSDWEKETSVESLERLKQQAVCEEEFEDCILLRDRIAALKARAGARGGVGDRMRGLLAVAVVLGTTVGHAWACCCLGIGHREGCLPMPLLLSLLSPP